MRSAHSSGDGNGRDSLQKGGPDGPRTRAPGNAAQALLFFRSFLKHPGMVGWLIPSSRFVVDGVLKNVDWNSAKVIVEYGPGLGTFTSRILERMRPDARLIVFEINPEFISFLKQSFSDSRLVLQERSADYVISGIPFRPISHQLRKSIVDKTHAILRPGGKFLVYQFSGAVLPYLRGSFDRVSCGRELLNLVPTRLFCCERRNNPHGSPSHRVRGPR
jgi:phospholipid N-methyltransferase